ncbi:MAG: hypothetical protein IPO06_15985 [Leptospiraceae bacterium]|nr:hypothetical protein [Leptospiraceae bacterium]
MKFLKRNSHYWVGRTLSMLIIFLIGILAVTGCGKQKKDQSTMASAIAIFAAGSSNPVANASTGTGTGTGTSAADTAIATDKAALVITYAGSDSSSNVTQNFTVSIAGASGTTISWSSNNGAVAIAGTVGTVTRSVGINHATVTLTATISKSGGTSDTKVFTLTVKRNITGTTALRVYGQDGSFTTVKTLSAYTLNTPSKVVKDSAGGTYIVDFNNNRVLYFSGTSMVATRVYGQGGSFITNTANKGGLSADSLNRPTSVAVDAGGVYIVDNLNHRVLYYSGTNTTATRVYGQAGSFIVGTANNGGITANSLNAPIGIMVDTGGVFIADSSNHRVLYYSGISTTATRVYGQGGIFTIATAATTANGLRNPPYVTADASGVYIVDAVNHRVLYYSGISTTASRVYGQGGVFTTGTANNPALNADSLNGPYDVALDASGVYISDTSNNRMLFYSGTSTTATRVYGQSGSFTTNTANTGGLGASSLSAPYGVFLDVSGVYVADYSNHRVLYYSGTSTTATSVYGQGSFTIAIANNLISDGGDSFKLAKSLAVDASGMYVADYSNHRVLFFPTNSTTATRVYGQGGSFTTNIVNKGGVSADSLNSPNGIALNGSGVYIADSLNHRVLYYSGNSTTATRVYGQGGSFITNALNNGGTVATDSLNTPYGLALDANGLYVSDQGNHRILYFNGIDMTPTRVYGQAGSFTTGTANNPGLSADSLNAPCHLALDSGGIYVADAFNSRVLYYSGTNTTATRVYGQAGSFSTGTANNPSLSANSLNQPYGVAVGIGGIYIADYSNHRVLFYPDISTTPTRVYGQGGSFTTNTLNNGGISVNSLNVPAAVTVDTDGSLYIADRLNNRVLWY